MILNHSRSALAPSPKFYEENFDIFIVVFISFRVPLLPGLTALLLISAGGVCVPFFPLSGFGFSYPVWCHT